MRVLGVDPGLTRCGIGVVEGGPGPAAAMVAVGVVRTPSRCPTPERLLVLAGRDRRVARPVPPRRRRRRAGLRRRQRRQRSWAPRRPRRSPCSPPRRAASRWTCTPRPRSRPRSPAAAAPTRPRSPRWSPASSGSTWRPGRPTPPTPWPWRSATSGAGAPRPGSTPRSRPGAGPPVIASVRGTGAARRPGPRGRRGRWRRHARAHDARARPPACGPGQRGVAWPPRWWCARTRSPCTASPTDDERDMFETVQTVSGVGPRLALAMLSVHAPDAAARGAVTTGDLEALTKVPGIGAKGAERIVLELRDKIGACRLRRVGAAGDRRGTGAPWRGQVAEALVGLGWSAEQAEDAVERGRPARPPTARRVRRCSGPALRELRPMSAAEPSRPRTSRARCSRTTARSRRPPGSSTPAARRRRPAGRGGAAAQAAQRVPRPDPRARPARRWCSRRPSAAAAPPTTCCCPGRPGSARPPWR